MTKLPINLLLYVAILGLFSGSGWFFYQFATEGRVIDQKQNRTELETILKRGEDQAGQDADDVDWSKKAFWEMFKEANFIGKEPPPPPTEPEENDKQLEPLASAQTPLEDIFKIVCLVYADSESRVIIQYKDSNVEPPPEVLEALNANGGGQPPVPAPDPRAPGGRRGGAAMPMPTFADPTQGLVHHMVLEDTLWKPFDPIRLVRVAPDASYAVFVREDKTKDKSEWTEEKLYTDVLELGQDILKQLHEGRIGDAQSRPARAADPAGSAQNDPWVPGPDTREVGRGQFHVGTADRERFRSDPNRIFNDVGTADYSGKNIRGVKITRVPSGYEKYGIEVGEVVISINGQPVRGRAEAITRGKALYKRGVRRFEAEFITPHGQRVVRTYVAPDEE